MGKVGHEGHHLQEFESKIKHSHYDINFITNANTNIVNMKLICIPKIRKCLIFHGNLTVAYGCP